MAAGAHCDRQIEAPHEGQARLHISRGGAICYARWRDVIKTCVKELVRDRVLRIARSNERALQVATQSRPIGLGECYLPGGRNCRRGRWLNSVSRAGRRRSASLPLLALTARETPAD